MKRTYTVAVLLSLLFAPSARASSNTWMYATPAMGHGADYLSSVWFSTQTTCLEANPYTRHGDGRFHAGKGAAYIGFAIGTEWAFLYLSSKTHNKYVRWVGRSVALVPAVNAGATAVYNVAQCRREMR